MKSARFAPVVPTRTTNIAVRIVVLFGIALASLVGWSTAFAQTPGSGDVANQPAVEFRLGFRALADRIPDVVGRPIEEEHYGANGDSLQQTTRGMMVWRKADNWTAFTDGTRSWISGPLGLQGRDNGGSFAWEARAASSGSEQGEVTLYDRRGVPICYVVADGESTIYLWTGEPIAYLYGDNVYGFNGRHLGWFQDGIFWDWEAVAVGFTAEAQGGYHVAEPVKEPKAARPAGLTREAAPVEPAVKIRDVYTALLSVALEIGRLK